MGLSAQGMQQSTGPTAWRTQMGPDLAGGGAVMAWPRPRAPMLHPWRPRRLMGPRPPPGPAQALPTVRDGTKRKRTVVCHQCRAHFASGDVQILPRAKWASGGGCSYMRLGVDQCDLVLHTRTTPVAVGALERTLPEPPGYGPVAVVDLRDPDAQFHVPCHLTRTMRRCEVVYLVPGSLRCVPLEGRRIQIQARDTERLGPRATLEKNIGQ